MKSMVNLSDYFETRKISLISSLDYDFVLDLYAPLIGIKNVSVYFALLGCETNEEFTHGDFLLKYRLSSGEFQNALSYLEAVGLISSFKKESDGMSHYIYTLSSPRTPAQFFSNELLYGTLRKNISEEECKRIAKKYMVDETPSDYTDVSEKFVELFHPDLETVSFKDNPQSGDKKFGKLSLGFDSNIFNKALLEGNPHMTNNSITKEELKRIARISALYGFEESAMASFVLTAYKPNNPAGSRVDFAHLDNIARENLKFDYLKKERLDPTRSEIHGQEPTARVIRLMDSKGAVEFLTILQRGNMPAPNDLKLINTLVADMGLPENVTNALIFYVLSVQENTLSTAYVTKLGGSLVREGITNALDALNFLGGHSKSKKNKKNEYSKAKPSKPKEAPLKKEEATLDDEDDDFESFLDSL